jgi:hypothetical protein
MMRRVLLAVLLALAAGCGSTSGDSSLLPSAPSSAVQVNDNFLGSVAVGSSDIHSFAVTSAGQPVTITLTAAGPPATIFMGVGVGLTTTDGVCSFFSQASVVTQAGASPALSGTIAAGTYCVAVFDAGNQTASVDYALTVSHY